MAGHTGSHAWQVVFPMGGSPGALTDQMANGFRLMVQWLNEEMAVLTHSLTIYYAGDIVQLCSAVVTTVHVAE